VPPSPQIRVFVSHTTRDKRDFALAHRLARGLRDLGVEAWIAPDSIPPGERWEPALVSSLMDGCTHFLAIASAASLSAEWVLKEIRLAEERSKTDPSFRVLPLPVGQTADSPEARFLSARQSIRYDDDPGRQLQYVAAALGIDYTPPPEASQRERALAYLERALGREQAAIRDIVRLRWVSPAIGAAVLVALWASLPDLFDAWGPALAATPAVTGLAAWGVTWRRHQIGRDHERLLDAMKDSLDLCADAEGPDCRKIWESFWRYAESNARALGSFGGLAGQGGAG
jgi:hypothetical protein